MPRRADGGSTAVTRWGSPPDPDGVLPAAYPACLERTVALLDGREAFIRPVLPGDAAALRKAVDRADPETLRTRFLGGSPPRSEKAFERLVCVDYVRRLALVALAPDGQGVGIARYEALGDAGAAEVAVVVDSQWRHVGLATTLLQVLATGAINNGILQFTAEFFADNLDVADLLAEAGRPFRTRADESGVVTAHLALVEGSDSP